VYNVVRQDIYNEAARFLGIFTVDHKTTELAAKVNRLAESGKEDDEIARYLNEQIASRNFNVDHVRDLRLVYTRRSAFTLDDSDDIVINEESIEAFLSTIPENELEFKILFGRIAGNISAEDMAIELGINTGQMYKIERELKSRIEKAIKEIV
jgi:hypothetical protein